MNSLKVLIDRGITLEDLSEDCLVLSVQENTSRVVLPSAFSKETALPVKEEMLYDISQARPSNG